MAAKKKMEETSGDLASTIAESLNKTNKEGQVAYFIGREETPVDLTDFISTGCSTLDLRISNRPNGGIPCGRISTLSGLEGSGKSLVCMHLIANVQKEGGVAVYVDTENALNEEFATAIGVDIGRMVYVQAPTIEDVFEKTEKIIEIVRRDTGDKKKKVLIVIDSIAAAPSKRQAEGTFDLQGFATDKARIISAALSKMILMIGKEKIAVVFTNQLRYKMNVQAFADPYTMPGGKGLPFYSSVILRFSKTGTIKAGDEVVGVSVKAKVEKNRLGPPLGTVDFDVYFDRGIDDLTSQIKFLKAKGIIKGDVRNYEFVDEDGIEYSFSLKEYGAFLAGNPSVADSIYKAMCNAIIMSYKTDNLSTEEGNVEVAQLEEGDD